MGRFFCCFTGSPVHDSDELDSCRSSSGRSRLSSPWSKFRAKKRTVPVDAAAAAAEIVEVDSAGVPERDLAKKGYFHKFHKKIRSRTKHNQQPIISTGTNIAKCAAARRPALLCQVREPETVKVRTSPSRTAGTWAEPKQSSCTFQKKKKKGRLGESDRQMVVLLMLEVALGTMLLGGPTLAIVSTSAWSYLSPYVKDITSRAKAAMNSREERRPGKKKENRRLIH